MTSFCHGSTCLCWRRGLYELNFGNNQTEVIFLRKEFLDKLIKENREERKKDYSYLKNITVAGIKHLAAQAIKECERPRLRRIK
jgi:hypothetical protein